MNGESMEKTIVVIWFTKIIMEELDPLMANPSSGLGTLTKVMYKLII